MPLTYKSGREELQWITMQQLNDLRKQQLERMRFPGFPGSLKQPGIVEPYSVPTSWPPKLDPMPTLPPQAVEPSPDHIWDMLVLAARSSRYG